MRLLNARRPRRALHTNGAAPALRDGLRLQHEPLHGGAPHAAEGADAGEPRLVVVWGVAADSHQAPPRRLHLVAAALALDRNTHRQLRTPPPPPHHHNNIQVRSYGVGQHVKLPGATKDSPNVYAFGTPYRTILEDLRSKDAALYARNGLLAMLERNVGVKAAPERWQLERCAARRRLGRVWRLVFCSWGFGGRRCHHVSAPSPPPTNPHHRHHHQITTNRSVDQPAPV